MTNTSEPDTIEFPYEFNDVDPITAAELMDHFTGERKGFVEIGPKMFFYHHGARDLLPHLWRFQARPDDVWISTFPRSGTTWTQEMIWLIINELNFDQAKQIPLIQRFPYFESNANVNNDVKTEILNRNQGDPVMQSFIKGLYTNVYDTLAEQKDQRFIKTHFPMSLLPPSVMQVKSKVIYVARNPKDVVVSYYHLERMLNPGFIGDFDTFCKYFTRNQTFCSPHFEHVNEAWLSRHEPNVLFIFYEDLIKDLPANLLKLAAFLGKSLNESDIERLCSHLSIESFKKNPAINRSHLKAAKVYNADAEDFIRNGNSSSGWPKEFTPESIEMFQRYVSTTYANTDLQYPVV